MENEPLFSNSGSQPIMRVTGLSKSYRRGGWPERNVVLAVQDVQFEIHSGKTLAVVGSSGSGKSTVARCVTRLEKPDRGQIHLDGTDIAQLDGRDLAPHRPKIQIVFQDATTSMNPRFTAAEVIEEPLLIQEWGDKSARQNRAQQLMKEVGLSPDWKDRSAVDFSGGQQQRLAIARALALSPKVLVLDEAFSGLDLSTEAQIANLLLTLQTTHGLAYLLISHDLALVARLADSVAVMAHGRIVEQGPTVEVLNHGQHSETVALLTARKTAQANLATVLGSRP